MASKSNCNSSLAQAKFIYFNPDYRNTQGAPRPAVDKNNIDHCLTLQCTVSAAVPVPNKVVGAVRNQHCSDTTLDRYVKKPLTFPFPMTKAALILTEPATIAVAQVVLL
jgi:hypothetical protein